MDLHPATALDGLPGIGPLASACADPDRAARSVLRALLGSAAGTAFAREHGIDGRTPPESFRRTVPIRRHAALAPWLDRALAGEPDVLFRGPIAMVARTTGTTGAPKLLPLPRAAVRAFREIQGWWGAALLRDHPRATDGRWLSLVHPRRLAQRPDGVSVGTVPGIGVAHGGALGGQVVAPPETIWAEPDPDRRLRATLAFAAAHDLSLVGAALPSLPLALLDALATADPSLGDEVAAVGGPERAAAWRRCLAEPGPGAARRLWPRLAALTTWRGGPSARYLPRLREAVGDLPIREVGYAASEGQFTAALWPETEGALLAASHYLFELVPGEIEPSPEQETLGPDEIEVGASYRLVVTTPSGLYRYDTEDVLTVLGRVGRLPIVAFSHRAGTAGAAAERMTEAHVTAAVRAAEAETGTPIADFVARPVWSDRRPPHWRFALATEGPLLPLASAIERALRAANELYDRRRAANALGPARAIRLDRDAIDPKTGHLDPTLADDQSEPEDSSSSSSSSSCGGAG